MPSRMHRPWTSAPSRTQSGRLNAFRYGLVVDSRPLLLWSQGGAVGGLSEASWGLRGGRLRPGGLVEASEGSLKPSCCHPRLATTAGSRFGGLRGPSWQTRGYRKAVMGQFWNLFGSLGTLVGHLGALVRARALADSRAPNGGLPSVPCNKRAWACEN